MPLTALRPGSLGDLDEGAGTAAPGPRVDTTAPCYRGNPWLLDRLVVLMDVGAEAEQLSGIPQDSPLLAATGIPISHGPELGFDAVFWIALKKIFACEKRFPSPPCCNGGRGSQTPKVDNKGQVVALHQHCAENSPNITCHLSI